MWDLRIANPLGRRSLRKFVMFVAAIVVTAFAYLLVHTPPVFALDGTWEDGSIVYQSETYTGPTTLDANNEYDLPSGTIVYRYVDGGTIHMVYFAPGSDPGSSAEAEYVRYSMSGTGALTRQAGPDEVTFDVAANAEEANQTASSQQESCRVDGVGWIICPITTFLAEGMDWVFEVLSGFLEVRPLETTAGNENVMLNIWNIMRGIANIAFVIAFLVIIYSHITSTGVSSYGIKKMFPRLVIAAILVNVSFWICALAIDISNILGHSLQQIFIGFRDVVLQGGENGWSLVSWESVAGFVITGGAAGAAAIVGATSMAATLGSFSVVGVMLLLLPVLVSALLTLLVVMLILAARQAIITILVILAPLAFVAYLLPNTEEWFKKWRSLFMTMLIFFPAFSFVFGGSQFAGLVIIQNANNINMVILGLAVQIAPLAITPLLLRLSGTLLSRIAGIINNPNKGLLDRTKNFSKDRLDALRAKNMAQNRRMAANGQLGRRHAMRRTALMLDNNKRLREGMKHIDEQDATSLFGDTAQGHALHEAEHVSKVLKETVETNVNAHLQAKVNLENTDLHDANLQLELAKAKLSRANEVTQANMANYRTGEYLNGVDENGRAWIAGQSVEARKAMGQLAHLTERTALEGMRKKSAERKLNSELAQHLESNATDQVYAAGVDNFNDRGRIRIVSELKSQIEGEKDTLVKNIKIATDIKPGDIPALSAKFKEAVTKSDAEGMRAYADLLVASANPGVTELRTLIASTENSMAISAKEELRAHINSDGAINAAAEDIATWSRDSANNFRTLVEITSDKSTWSSMTASAFAGMKKSSQEAALRVPGAVSQKTAQAILNGPVFQGLKPDMQIRIEKLANGRSDYNAGIADPFTETS